MAAHILASNPYVHCILCEGRFRIDEGTFETCYGQMAAVCKKCRDGLEFECGRCDEMFKPGYRMDEVDPEDPVCEKCQREMDDEQEAEREILLGPEWFF